MRLFLSILILTFLSSSIFGQGFDLSKFETIKSKYFIHSSKVEDFLPKPIDKFGKTDYTTYIQRALDRGTNLIFPDYPLLIDDRGLKIGSNKNILFQENSKLVLKSSKKPAYKAINISNAQNVNIYFLNLVGDRYNHLADDGQWGHGVSISVSQSISLYYPRIAKFWGDGIYIGNNKGNAPSNISVIGGIIDENRRNGISIVSGKNVTISGTKISNTSGQSPQSGIDIEPNGNDNILKNILLENVITENNAMHGIIISPGSMKGKNKKDISITINNAIDNGSKIGLGVSLERMGRSKLIGIPLNGTININNPIWKNNKSVGFKNYGNADRNLKVSFKNVKIYKKVNGKEVLDNRSLQNVKRSILYNEAIKIE